MNRHPESGFTLIETLVALAVLATSGVALMGATQAHISRITALEARAAAQWVAENYLAEVRLGLTPPARPDSILGMDFTVDVLRSQTEDPELERIDLSVTRVADGTVYAILTGFIDVADTTGRQP